MDSGQVYPASLIGFDQRSDLAVIKINPEVDLKPIEVSNSASVQVGDQVIAVEMHLDWAKLLPVELLVLLEEIMEIHILN